MSAGILEGVRVVEIAGIGPGPFCGMHLADLGADVICVERAGAASVRTAVQRGKRSVLADLKTESGRELVLKLAAGADALIEGMRPGAMERLGLGPAECMARNPRLVYGRITGWGQSGPLAQAAGHDNNYIALSGALYFTGAPPEPPSAPLAVLGDVAGGALYLAIGLLAGILRARATGRGAVVDAAMADGAAHMLHLLLGSQQKGMTNKTRGGGMHESSHFFGTFLCSDGEYVTLGAIEPQFHAELLRKLGLQDDPGFAAQWDRARWPAMKARIAALIATRTRGEWTQLLEGSDACFAPVLSPHEAALHPHHLARGTFFCADGQLQAAPAPRFDGERASPGRVPASGEHTDEVLQRLAQAGESPWSPRS
ncbi:MAG TPA: CaiB/BaiF CoA-transferase family protein [Ramlibacter sp.]|nr:CaiB/BaiF CoA-transferase family protein [Ramlibacter sp.]